MATFLQDLWEAIFTPGPTPTLLIATNASFAALQLLLFGLLLATYSVHFVVLSVLCAGLWWSINWFAAEIKLAQEEEERKKAQEKEKEKGGRWRSKTEVADSADDEGEKTEVEAVAEGGMATEGGNAGMKVKKAASQSSGVRLGDGLQARQRKVEEGDLSGEASTDSEWEKVSQDGRS